MSAGFHDILPFCRISSRGKTALPFVHAFPFFFEELCSDEHLDPFEHESFDMLDLHYLPCPSPSLEEYAGAALSLERSF